MQRIRVKICGITRPEDAQAAAYAGADAIGLVFYPGSARAVDTLQARAIVTALPPFVTTVGLFVDAEPAAVRAVLAAVALDNLQFHGSEAPDYCAAFGRPYIKAVAMGAAADAADVADHARRYASATGLLLDSHGGGKVGGTGQVFDWDQIPTTINKPLILAGGLNPVNVGEALVRVRPYGVDVSSGVESAKGIKDAHLIAAFMRSIEQHAPS